MEVTVSRRSGTFQINKTDFRLSGAHEAVDLNRVQTHQQRLGGRLGNGRENKILYVNRFF